MSRAGVRMVCGVWIVRALCLLYAYWARGARDLCCVCVLFYWRGILVVSLLYFMCFSGAVLSRLGYRLSIRGSLPPRHPPSDHSLWGRARRYGGPPFIVRVPERGRRRGQGR